MDKPPTILAFMAHPDDVEFLCAGTLARLRREVGCRIAIATSTSGDCGSATQSRDEIARIRHREAQASAALLDAEYLCAGADDLFVLYDRATLQSCVEIVRRSQADIVITHSPADYMVDHEMTSRLVRSACFGAPIPNVGTSAADPAEPLERIPHLFYADPIEGKDPLGRDVEADFVIDISNVIDLKEQMLACHVSQREWLRAHHGMDQYVISMKEWSARRGRDIGVEYGEGFRQHLGHAYPQDNALMQMLDR